MAKSKTPQPYRRLDALARLLEGNGICAAVGVYNKRLLVASNEIDSSTTDRKAIFKFTRMVLEHFSTLAKSGEGAEPKIEVLKEICTSSIEAEKRRLPAVRAELIEEVVADILQAKNLTSFDAFEKAIQAYTVDKVLKRYGRGVGTQVMEAVSIIYDRGRDFLKLQEALTTKKAEFPDLCAAVANCTPASILMEGQQRVHAEMRIIDHILAAEKAKGYGGPDMTQPDGRAAASEVVGPIYIGISKLCCKDCYAAVKAAKTTKLIEEKLGKSERAALQAAEATPAAEGATEMLRPIALLFEARDTHGIQFGKWVKPEFLKNPELLKEYTAALTTIGAHSGARGMGASVSESGTGTQPPPPSTPAEIEARTLLLPDVMGEFRKKLEDRMCEGEEDHARLALLAALQGFARFVAPSAKERTPTPAASADDGMDHGDAAAAPAAAVESTGDADTGVPPAAKRPRVGNSDAVAQALVAQLVDDSPTLATAPPVRLGVTGAHRSGPSGASGRS